MDWLRDNIARTMECHHDSSARLRKIRIGLARADALIMESAGRIVQHDQDFRQPSKR